MPRQGAWDKALWIDIRTLKSTAYLDGVEVDVAFSDVCLFCSMLAASATVGAAVTALEVPPPALGPAILFM